MSVIPKVKVHPTVLVTIVDAFERLSKKNDRVIGTLLGYSDKTGVEITNCFPVPHVEDDGEVQVDLNFANSMKANCKLVNDTEKVVGWFSTWARISESDVLIHEYYSVETSSPIFMTVDCELTDGRMAIKAYMGCPVGLNKDSTGGSGVVFTPIPSVIESWPAEATVVETLKKSYRDPQRIVRLNSGSIEQSERLCDNIQQQLAIALDYVEDVINGRIEPDPAVGRMLMDIVDTVPTTSAEKFDELMTAGIKVGFRGSEAVGLKDRMVKVTAYDMQGTTKQLGLSRYTQEVKAAGFIQNVLMVVYLANLSRTQLILNDKISLL